MSNEALSDWILVSKIPQFIHDLNNPWIERNKDWLEQRPEPLRDLCDLNSPLRNEGTDGRVYPPDLFRRLKVNNNRGDISRRGWDNALQRLREIKSCPAALNDAQHFHVDIYLYSKASEPADPGTEIPRLFVDVLRRMHNLKRLDWGLPPESTQYFGAYFTKCNLVLPSVTHLVVGAFGDYIVPMCPSLVELRAGSYLDHWSWSRCSSEDGPDPHQQLIKSASHVKGIRALSLRSGNDGWNTWILQEIQDSMPNILHLKMDGNLHPIYGQVGGSLSPGVRLREILVQLGQFALLQRLDLPPVSNLDVDFDGGPWCGNAFMGPNGWELGKKVSKQRAEATEFAGAIVLECLPHLKALTIGSTPCVIITTDDGKQALRWDWTDRMDDWLEGTWRPKVPRPSTAL